MLQGSHTWTLGEATVTDGLILEELAFRVRAITLDHGTPVLAFAFEQPRQFSIRKDRLTARGLVAGPWLGELKFRLACYESGAPIRLPDGRIGLAGTLAEDLVLITPGQKLVYATDLANTLSNRERLATLAKDAHTFFCEATFVAADAAQARQPAPVILRLMPAVRLQWPQV